jgi:hypothetical protein
MLLNLRIAHGMKVISYPFIMMLIPIILSAFTHLWNPIGFPYTQADEGIYLHRAMNVLKGMGPHEIHPDSVLYDHPYFGQLFLAGVFKIIGFPDSFHPSDSVHSIEMLYLIPRVLMGILAVVDTFLIYKIAECRYNRKVALIASILFAVMPITWITRWIFLDSIQLPFLLSSILFALYSYSLPKPKKNSKYDVSNSSSNSSSHNNNNQNTHLMVLLSGIFLGISIFTKMPAFTMIPLVGYLVFSSWNNSNNNNRSNIIDNRVSNTKRLKPKLKTLGLWFIPVILIPAIWPAYAMSIGQFNKWEDGVLWQASGRPASKPLVNSLNEFFKIDPVLLLLGIVGLIFAVIKRDFLVLLWAIPFLIFLYIVGYVSLFHLIPLLPVFCIAAARSIADLLVRTVNMRKIVVVNHNLLLIVIVSAIGIFGLTSTSMLIMTNRNSSFFEVYAFIVQHLPNKTNLDNKINDKVTMLGNNWGGGAGVWSFSWIPKYVLQKNFDFYGISKTPVATTQKVILIADSRFKHLIADDSTQGKLLQRLYNDATKTIKRFHEKGTQYDYHQYPYASMNYNNKGIGRIEIRANY